MITVVIGQNDDIKTQNNDAFIKPVDGLTVF